MKRTNKSHGNHYTGKRLTTNLHILKPMRFENLQRFKYFLNRFKGGRVLDLGCGIGEGSTLLSKREACKVFAVDQSYEVIHTARTIFPNSSVYWTVADGGSLCYAHNTFDAVISIEVIEHIPDLKTFLSEIQRVIRPGGFFMLSTPNRLISSPNLNMLWPEHFREYSPIELKSLLETYFKKVEIIGETIPIYENNPIRRLVHRLAPLVKPRLPNWLRIRALPILQTLIKERLQPEDVVFIKDRVDEAPTILAVCYP